MSRIDKWIYLKARDKVKMKPGLQESYRCICCVCEKIQDIGPSKAMRSGDLDSNIAVGKCPACNTTLIYSIYPDLSGKYMVSKKLADLDDSQRSMLWYLKSLRDG